MARIRRVFFSKQAALFHYDRPNRHYDRPNLREVPSALHISTVVVAIWTVVIGENTQKRGKSPFLTSENRVNICLELGFF